MEFAVHTALQDIPARVIANAKLAILDCLGVSILASQFELAKKLFRLALQESWHGPCQIWGSNMTASARDAAFANGALAHALDYDDGGHVTTFILAAATAVAEREDASGVQLLTAFIIGREVRMAMDALFSNRFEGNGPGARGWHANGILGPVAAACASGKILNLNAQQTLNAIGLAAGSCGALGRDGGTMAKPLRAGQAALSGVAAALLACNGCTADSAALEGPHGLFSALGPLDEKILSSLGHTLGREYDWETKPVKIKRYPTAAATHAPVEAMVRLLAKRRLAPGDVKAIECHLKPFPLLRLSPQSGDEGRFSMAYCLAVALVFGHLTPEDFAEERARDQRITELLAKVRHHDDTKSLTVILTNGEKLLEPIWPATDLHGWDEAVEKFIGCTRDALSETHRSRVIEMVDQLDKLSAVRSLTETLRPSSNS